MNMRERIWRSIQQQNLDNGGVPIQNTDADRIADAVLDALMAPTEAMLEARDIPGWDDIVTQGLGAEIFTAMVRSAKEGK